MTAIEFIFPAAAAACFFKGIVLLYGITRTRHAHAAGSAAHHQMKDAGFPFRRI